MKEGTLIMFKPDGTVIEEIYYEKNMQVNKKDAQDKN